MAVPQPSSSPSRIRSSIDVLRSYGSTSAPSRASAAVSSARNAGVRSRCRCCNRRWWCPACRRRGRRSRLDIDLRRVVPAHHHLAARDGARDLIAVPLGAYDRVDVGDVGGHLHRPAFALPEGDPAAGRDHVPGRSDVGGPEAAEQQERVVRAVGRAERLLRKPRISGWCGLISAMASASCSPRSAAGSRLDAARRPWVFVSASATCALLIQPVARVARAGGCPPFRRSTARPVTPGTRAPHPSPRSRSARPVRPPRRPRTGRPLWTRRRRRTSCRSPRGRPRPGRIVRPQHPQGAVWRAGSAGRRGPPRGRGLPGRRGR